MRAPYLDDGDVRLYQGDVIDVLREMDAESVQTCVTSPPYWGLRDYGEPGQLGLEPTPGEYVARMVEVFREVRRVLREDGTLWLNLGDSYAGSGPSGAAYQSDTTKRRAAGGMDGAFRVSARLAERGLTYAEKKPVAPPGLKPKDLVGIPWRVALALQEDGWWLRSDVIWSKPNPMPESVTDRPTRSHEYLFLLTKSARYFYDAEAVAERAVGANAHDLTGGGMNVPGQSPQSTRAVKLRNVRPGVDVAGGSGQCEGFIAYDEAKRNARSVWTITTKPYSGAHFATFPPELPSRCIKAATPEAGCCAECGAPRERVIVATSPDGRSAEMRGGKAYDAEGRPLMGDNMIDHGTRGSWNSGGATLKRETAGFRASCDCDAPGVGAIVLDPFSGAATTALAARELGRRAVGIELNPDYLAISADRLKQLSLFSEAS